MGGKRPKKMSNTRRQDTKKVFREEGRGELVNATSRQSAEDTELTIRCGKLEDTGGLAQNNFNGGGYRCIIEENREGRGTQKPQPYL